MDDRSACEPFISHDQFAACCSLVTDEMTEEDTLEVRQAASDVLAFLSGWTVFGVCSATVRPQGVMCLDGQDAIPLTWPVRSVDEVWVDGTQLDFTQYAIVDKRYLIRRDCLAWPCWQYDGRPHTEMCTFEITYTFGTDIPFQATLAAGELACEFQLGCSGADCKLPASATAVNTQGLSMSLAGEEVAGSLGRGELPLVQEFLATINPNSVTLPTDIYSPDMPKLRRIEYPSA